MSETVLQKPKRFEFVTRKWFRVTMLIGIMLFEIALTWYLKTFGWLETLDTGTQLLVLVVAGSPLILAAFIMFGKRFRLSSMLIAIGLISVFLTFVMQPVWRESQDRIATRALLDAQIFPKNKSYFLDVRSTSRGKPFELEVKPTPGWIARMLGDKAQLLRDYEIVEVSLSNDSQIDQVGDLFSKCDSLRHINISSGVTNNGLKALVTKLKGTKTDSFFVGDYGMIADIKLSHFDELQPKQLYIANLLNPEAEINAADCFSNLEHLSVLSDEQLTPDFDWEAILNNKKLQHVRSLYLLQQSRKIGRNEFAALAKWKNIENLLIGSDQISNLDFVTELPNLKSLTITGLLLDEDVLNQLKKIEKLNRLEIFNCKTASPDFGKGLDRLKKALPGCETISCYEQLP